MWDQEEDIHFPFTQSWFNFFTISVDPAEIFAFMFEIVVL